MADKIDYIKDRRGRKRFPITHEKGVRDSNWVRLEEKLKGIESTTQKRIDTLTAEEKTSIRESIGALSRDDIPSGKFYGYFESTAELPDGDVQGYAYVGISLPFTVYSFDGTDWEDNGVSVSNPPIGNEEDISQDESGKLQFANRVYDAQQPNGLGYKILRKDASFASQVTDTNTIYEIRYPFNLNGATFTIPAGCILRFNGGELTNGTLSGNGTSIDADAVQIFSGITVAGTWKVERIFSVWFAKDKYTIGNVLAMNNADIYTEIIIDGDYNVFVPESGTSGIAIVSNTKVNISGRLTKDSSSVSSYSSVLSIRGSNVSIVGGIIDGNKDAFSETHEYGHGFEVANSFGCGLYSVTIMNCHGDGVYVGGQNVNRNFTIKNCEIYGCRRNGISVIFAQGFLVAETFIHDISGKAPGAGIDVEPNYDYQLCKNIAMNNCIIKDCRIGISLSGGQASIEKSFFSNCLISLSDYYNILSIENSKDTSFVSCSFSTTGVRGTSYAITGSNPGNVMFKNCTFTETYTQTAGSLIAIYCSWEECNFNITYRFMETIGGYFKDCNIQIQSGGLSAYAAISGAVLENCQYTGGGITLSGRSAEAPAKHIRIKDCVANITSAYYPIFGNYTEDVEITGCKLTLAGTRNLVNFNNSKEVRIKNNTIVVGSNNAAIAFDENALNCQAKENLISAADGVTWSGTKYSGINNKTATSNIPGDPFYFEGEHKMLMFNGTSVVNLDGTALS